MMVMEKLRAMYDAIIKALQRLPAAAGLDPGSIDGLRGPRTEAAVRAWLAKVAPSVSAPEFGCHDRVWALHRCWQPCHRRNTGGRR